jgi:hypothetical protein
MNGEGMNHIAHVCFSMLVKKRADVNVLFIPQSGQGENLGAPHVAKAVQFQ